MALNASGTISIGGSTAGQSINLELGRAAGASSNLNESALRGLAGVASGAIALSNFHGKSSGPTYVGAAIGGTTVNYPAGTQSGDMVVLYIVSASGSFTAPAGWTFRATITWSAGFGYITRTYTKVAASETSVTVSDAVNGSVLVVVFRGVSSIGAVGAYAESAGAGATTFQHTAITTTSASSRVIGYVCDRDPVAPTAAGGYTSRLSTTTTYFGYNVADANYPSIGSTGNPAWGQSSAAGYPAVGHLIELVP